MYLARFQGEEGERLVAAVQLKEWSHLGRWSAEICSALSRGLRLPGSTLALRTRLRDGEPSRVALLGCSAGEEAMLRSVLEDLQSNSSAEVGRNAGQAGHDEIAARFPAARHGWMQPGGYRSGPYRLATDFRLFPVLDRLAAAAVTQGWDVAYQANVYSAAPAREDLRWLKKQLVRMELDGRIPAAVLDLQKSIVDRFSHSTHRIDELVGCGEEQSWRYLHRLIEDEFALPMRRYGFDSPPLESGEPFPFEEALVTGFPVEMLAGTDAVARAAAAQEPEKVEEVLRWYPQVDDVRRTPRRRPTAAARVFLSYSSRNQSAAQTVCEALERQGIGCWIAPRDILPGVPYPDAIMEGLRSCEILVVLLSVDASASAHVAREVERAVSRKVPVLALRLDRSPLSDTLDYLLGATQWLDTADPPTEDQLRELARSMSRLLDSEQGRAES